MSIKNSSPGVDGLPMRLFKDNINVLADTIVFICNRSLDTGIFPKKLMIAIITCLHKAGDLHNLENYRAISILCAFSKILEKIVALQLVEYFIENNILTECQFGYRSGVSTSDAVLSIVDSLYDAFDRSKSTVGVFLDLAKAFDTLDMNILIEKLNYYIYEVGGVELEWFWSYFSERKQLLKYGGVNSDLMSINYGVPQGSVLGPILFCIFMNDIVKSSNYLNFVLYADETCVFRSDSDISNNISIVNRELLNVKKWMQANCLTLNFKKCHYLLFRRKQRVLPDNINNIYLGGAKVE